MDISIITNQIWGTLWYLLPIVILMTFVRSPTVKGWVGELLISIASRFLLDTNVYHKINNVTLPTEDGTTQIDHIFVSVFGVFVVETKNMKGWIFGSPGNSTWTQKIYRHTNRFQNPLRQNHKHVKTLQSLLGLTDQQVHSVVVFVGDSQFKTEMPENVMHGALRYADHIKSSRTIVLTESQVEEIISKIATGRLTPSFKTNREHVRHVREIVAGKTNGSTTSTPNCPQCNGSMVLRQAKSGRNTGKEFWGCSQYPRCRGLVNVA